MAQVLKIAFLVSPFSRDAGESWIGGKVRARGKGVKAEGFPGGKESD